MSEVFGYRQPEEVPEHLWCLQSCAEKNGPYRTHWVKGIPSYLNGIISQCTYCTMWLYTNKGFKHYMCPDRDKLELFKQILETMEY